MDLGVGSFVFAQGVVSALPLIKDPSYLSAPAIPKIISVTRKCLPILGLGLIRVILVKGTDYPVRAPTVAFSEQMLTSWLRRSTSRSTVFIGTSLSHLHSSRCCKCFYIHSLHAYLPRYLASYLLLVCPSIIPHFGRRFNVTVSVFSAQQLTLSWLGGQQIVFHAPRTNVFTANKEGLISLLGQFILILYKSTFSCSHVITQAT
jgi:phosphatidylinositol glycan class W